MITSDEQIEKHFCVHRIGPLHHPLCPLCLNDHLPVRAGEKKGNLPVIDFDNSQLLKSFCTLQQEKLNPRLKQSLTSLEEVFLLKKKYV